MHLSEPLADILYPSHRSGGRKSLKVGISPADNSFSANSFFSAAFAWFKLYFAFQIDVADQQNALIDVVVKSFHTDFQFRVVGYDDIWRLALSDQGSHNCVHLQSLMTGEIDSLSGRRAKFLIFMLCKAGIVNIFMGNGTAAEGFPTTVADAGSPVETSALLFDKRRTHLTTFDAGSAFRVTEDDLTANIGFTTAEASGTEVVRVVENPSGMYIIHPVEPDLFGDGIGGLTKESGDVFKRTSLLQRILDILSVSESKMFLITWKRM